MGDGGVLVEVGGSAEAHRVRARLVAAALPGVVDLVVGARSVLAVVDPLRCDPAAVAAAAVAAGSDLDRPHATVHELAVRYDGADLAEVAVRTGLTAADVVRRHVAAVYTVAFLGFAPGFGYLTGLDPVLWMPRRAVPRDSVPAGSVAVAGDLTAVYPVASPGGWQLLGHTEAVLFDPDRRPPALFAPGDVVRFVAAP